MTRMLNIYRKDTPTATSSTRWVARPDPSTTCEELARACRELDLSVALVDSEIHLVLVLDIQEEEPCPDALAAALFGENNSATVIAEGFKYEGDMDLDNKFQSLEKINFNVSGER